MSYVAQRREIDALTDIKLNGRIQMMPTFFYDYEEGDLRRDISAKPYYFKDGAATMCTDASTFYLSKWRAEWMTRRVLSKDDGVNFMVLRLADVYLMNAEANIELGNLAEARTRIIDVRRRAFADASAAEAPVNAAASAEELTTLLRTERAKEFVGEGIRRWDLMRWGILKETLDQVDLDLDMLRRREGRYADVRDVIYYKDNGEGGFDIYGFNRDEDDAPAGYKTKTKWIRYASKSSESSSFENFIGKVQFDANGNATDELVGSVYYHLDGLDTHIRQVMPIMNVILASCQNALTNAYGY